MNPGHYIEKEGTTTGTFVPVFIFHKNNRGQIAGPLLLK